MRQKLFAEWSSESLTRRLGNLWSSPGCRAKSLQGIERGGAPVDPSASFIPRPSETRPVPLLGLRNDAFPVG
jgi:hypothetical protein